MRTVLILHALLLGGTLAGAAPAAAQATPDTLKACYVTGSGTVYRVGVSGTPAACKSNHVPFQLVDGVGLLRLGDAATGDLSGTYPAPTVAKLQGRAIADAAPGDGQVIAWSAGQNRWEPRDPAASANVSSVIVDGAGGGVAVSLAFIGTPATVNLNRTSTVLVISTKSVGSAYQTGAHGLTLDMCYRPAGGALIPDGMPIHNIQSEAGNRMPHTLSTTFALPPGSYDVGMCGYSGDDAGSWNYNDGSRTTALILPGS